MEGHRIGTAQDVRGKTRHIILVRHGQYEETSEDDEHRKLTPLGRRQATATGKRIAEYLKGSDNFEDPSFHGPCHLKAIRVSDMTRAKETAELIAKELGDSYKVEEPDPMLNEALPSPMIPIRPDIKDAEEEIDENHDRIEQAFRKYFYREAGSDGEYWKYYLVDDEDEFEIIVCHGALL